MTVGVTIDGYTFQEILKIIAATNTDDKTGASGGAGYRGETQAVATTEEAAPKTGPVDGVYDPELAAFFSGEL